MLEERDERKQKADDFCLQYDSDSERRKDKLKEIS
jgi:hypothetical protein